MERHYDFVAIGGGSAGFNAARMARRFCTRVAIIDGAAELGGLCILRGCMPSKTLIYVSENQHHAAHGARLGLNLHAGVPDMAAVRARKRRIIGDFAAHRVRQLESGQYELLRRHARFTGPNELALDDGSRVTADRILIGTGSKVGWPMIPGLRAAKPWTSDEVLELDFLPPSVIVLGGGVVACELAQYLARMGSRVTQVQRSAHVLRSQSPEAGAVVAQAFRDEGIELFTNTILERVEFDGAEFAVTFQHGHETLVRRARHCVNALGRQPDTSALDLAQAGIETELDGRIPANEYQQTSNPRVYAAGDCTGPHEIVHVAIQQAEVAVKHAFGQRVEPMNYDSLLQVVFTDPQVATLGLSQADLDARAIPYVAASYPFNDHGKSILMEANYGYVKIFAAPKGGRVLGAEIVGREAGELIHSLTTAVSARLTVHDLLRAPWYHPTLAEIITYPLEDIAELLGSRP